jgi:hypothetical protein
VKPFKGKSREVMILLRRRICSLYGVVGCLMWKCSNRPDAVDVSKQFQAKACSGKSPVTENATSHAEEGRGAKYSRMSLRCAG